MKKIIIIALMINRVFADKCDFDQESLPSLLDEFKYSLGSIPYCETSDPQQFQTLTYEKVGINMEKKATEECRKGGQKCFVAYNEILPHTRVKPYSFIWKSCSNSLVSPQVALKIKCKALLDCIQESKAQKTDGPELVEFITYSVIAENFCGSTSSQAELSPTEKKIREVFNLYIGLNKRL